MFSLQHIYYQLSVFIIFFIESRSGGVIRKILLDQRAYEGVLVISRKRQFEHIYGVAYLLHKLLLHVNKYVGVSYSIALDA